MLPYFFILFLIFFLGLSTKSRVALGCCVEESQNIQKRIFYVIIISIVLILFSGLRYDVGSDWFPYYYTNHATYKKSLNYSYVEIGWKIYGYLITTLYDRFGIVMFVTSIVTIGLFTKTISKYSTNIVISLLLFFFLDYDKTFNAVRQYLAASILFFGHRAIFDKKFLKWCFIVILATSFHTTSIIMILCYFLVNRRINRKQMILILAFTIVSLTSYDLIFNFIGWYKNSNIDLSTTLYAERSINIFRVLIQWVPVVFYFTVIHLKQINVYDREINFYANFIIFGAAVMTATCNSAYLGRIATYFSTYVTLAIPLMTNTLNKKDKLLTNTIFVIFYGIYWFSNLVTHPSIFYSKTWLSL